MPFNRVLLSPDSKLPRPMRAGDGLLANLSPRLFSAEVDLVLTAGDLGGGLIHQGTTLTSDVSYVLPTALIIAESNPTMDVGDAYSFIVTNSQAGAFDVLIAVNTDITAVGANNTLATPPQSTRIYTLVKTGEAAFDLY